MSAGTLYDPRRLGTELAAAGVEAVLATRPANVLHLTRYRKGGAAMAVVTAAEPAEPVLLLPASDIDFALEDPLEPCDVRAFGVFYRHRDESAELDRRERLVAELAAAANAEADAIELVASVLSERGVAGTIAIDAPAVLGRPLASEAWSLDARPELFDRLRMIKTGEEVERLRRAAAVAEDAIERTNERVAEGVTQRELARAFAVATAEAGCAVRMANVSLGRATAFGNVNQPDDVVEPGIVIRYDVGAIADGYASDLSRCFSYGPAPGKARTYHAALVRGQEAALAILRPGVRCSQIHAEAVATVRDAGIPHYERTNVGHGIGIAGDGYDAPLLAPTDETEIEPGMVLCVETPYYELGFGGLQVEDMVVVTPDGYEVLTHLPTELRELS